MGLHATVPTTVHPNIFIEGKVQDGGEGQGGVELEDLEDLFYVKKSIKYCLKHAVWIFIF